MTPYKFGKWRVWTADGIVYDGECPDHSRLVPKTGLIVINQEVDGSRRTLAGHDYYWFIKDEWCGGDYPGLIQHLMKPGKTQVWFGVNVGSDVFAHFLQLAHNDPAFPRVRAA